MARHGYAANRSPGSVPGAVVSVWESRRHPWVELLGVTEHHDR
jgi:hypothetical protein